MLQFTYIPCVDKLCKCVTGAWILCVTSFSMNIQLMHKVCSEYFHKADDED
jgi:hypothetical protein